MEFDFGLPALGGQFHMDWIHDGANPRDVVRHWARLSSGSEEGLEELRLLRQDVRLLLTSPLSDEDIHALWRSAARYYPNFLVEGQEPARGRAWLTDIDGELEPFLHESASGSPTPQAADEPVQSAIDELADRLAPRSELSLEPLPSHVVIAAVKRCAKEVSPALAFRFLLHAYSAYDSPVPAASRAAFEELNREFGYGEFMLVGIQGLPEK
ncbi:hypothetical protein ACFY12_29455 [Streptomyces sp. NPDC001339]|uniref:hypothetical protein n=1 Tax=Streptomyces sp. NPDC001339 TaxID=3364563 RepID=UPI0036AC11ED